MIKVLLHATDSNLSRDLPIADVSDVIQRPGELLWVDVEAPSPEDLNLLSEEFGFHPLAIEDVARRHQRPKVDVYGNIYFLVFYGFESDESSSLVQVGIFIGSNYVVTVHERGLPALTQTCDRWHDNSGRIES